MTQRQRHRDAFGVIGWLFADLMLVLAVLFLASSTVARPLPSASLSPTPSPSAVAQSSELPTSAPSPTPSPTRACRTTVALKKYTVVVPPRSDGRRATDAELSRAFRRFAKSEVGLLQTFVHGSSPSNGVEQAMAVNIVVSRAYPKAITKQTIKDAFFDGHRAQGSVKFEVYLMADECS